MLVYQWRLLKPWLLQSKLCKRRPISPKKPGAWPGDEVMLRLVYAWGVDASGWAAMVSFWPDMTSRARLQ